MSKCFASGAFAAACSARGMLPFSEDTGSDEETIATSETYDMIGDTKSKPFLLG